MFEFREVAAPYPGLRPFEPHESEIFFGREGHAARLLEILQRERFLAVIGPSGCGKSSLVRAGLLPGLATGALGTGTNWRAAILRPGSRPILALAHALLGPHAFGHELAEPEGIPHDTDHFTADVALAAAELRRGTRGLVNLVQTAMAKQPANSPPVNLLVLVDQFEEIFTYARSGGAEADESDVFVDLLLAARDDVPSRIHVVLTMRTDFLGDCVRFQDLPEAINRAQYLTPKLSPDQMQRAIVGPARVFDGDVDRDLAVELINSVGQDSDQLPILQHALARMWRAAKTANPTAPEIGWSTVEAVGGIGNALDRHAEEVLKGLSEQRALAETLFRAITDRRQHEGGSRDVRRPQTLAAIAAWAGVEPGALEPVITAYAAPDVTLLQHGRDLNAQSVIDLTHEALIRQWGTLKGWVSDEYQRASAYRRWSQRAAEYRSGGSGLLTGNDLARALEWWDPAAEHPSWQPTARWAQRYTDAKPDDVAEELARTLAFIVDSRDAEAGRQHEEQRRLTELAESERRRANAERQRAEASRRMTWLVIVVSAMAVLAAAAAATAVWYQQRARIVEETHTAVRFEAHLTHASALARVDDYAEALKVLAVSRLLDPVIPEPRRRARNLLAGYVEMVGGRADLVYEGAAAQLTGGVAVSPDGKLIAAAGERGTLVLFDVPRGTLLRRLEGHDPTAPSTGDVRSVVFDPKNRWLLSAGEDRRIIRWSLPGGDKLSEWTAPKPVWALAISPDGGTLATGDRDDITIWSVANGKPIRSLKGHTGGISSANGLSFSPDGTRLASAAYDQTARVWDWAKGTTLRILTGAHTDALWAIAFSPDGKWLATAGADQRVVFWSAATGKSLGQLLGHRNVVYDVAFTADGGQLLSASRDNTVRLWDVSSGTTQVVYQGHTAAPISVVPHGNVAYTAANDGTVRRWTVATPGQWLWESDLPAMSAAISPDGRVAAVGLQNGTLRLHALPEGGVVAEHTGAHLAPGINRIAFDGSGTLVATVGMDRKGRLWQVHGTGGHVKLTPLVTFEGHTDGVHGVAFSPDGRILATAGYDGKVGLFDVASGKGRLFEAHDGIVVSVAFNSRGDRLLSAGAGDFRLRIWDVADPSRPLRDLPSARDALLWATFRPDDLEVAAVGRETHITLHDLSPTARAARNLVGHEETVYRVVYSPDGGQLATVSKDRTVRVWDRDSARLLFTVALPSADLWDFDFRCTAAGECWIVVPLMSKRVAVYRLPYAK